MKDTLTNNLTVVSQNSSGVIANGLNFFSSLSPDGRYVAWQSTATNLIPGVSGQQIYIKDTRTGQLTLGSSNSSGQAGNSGSGYPSISLDGRIVTFQSNSTNLVTGVTSDQIFAKNLVTGSLTVVSANQSGVNGNGTSQFSAVSGDGSSVVFESDSTNLISGVSGNQIYLKSLNDSSITLVSSNDQGIAGNGYSYWASLSYDGKKVAFLSDSSNLIAGVTGTQMYLKDLASGRLSLISSSSLGVAGNGDAIYGQISADGQFAVFNSTASNLISGVGGENYFRKNLVTGEIEVLNVSSSGNLAGGGLDPAFISQDGLRVVFSSASSTLVTGDTNGFGDVFLRDASKAGVDELAGMVVSDRFSSKITLTLAKERLDKLNLARASIGSSVSRIETSLSNLSTATSNLASAVGQITDTDLAEESATLVANQILQRAGAAVLAQANIQPQLALQLLQGL